jgi:hypothetical protein
MSPGLPDLWPERQQIRPVRASVRLPDRLHRYVTRGRPPKKNLCEPQAATSLPRPHVLRPSRSKRREGLARRASVPSSGAERVARGIDPRTIADALRVNLEALALMEDGRMRCRRASGVEARS